MARSRSRNWTISSPGREPNLAIVFDLPDGAVIDLDEVVFSSSIATLLTGENAQLNTVVYTDENGAEHAIGTVLIFDLVAAADIAENHSEQVGWDPANAHRIYVRYKTDDQPDHQDLTYEKIVEVYTRLQLL